MSFVDRVNSDQLDVNDDRRAALVAAAILAAPYVDPVDTPAAAVRTTRRLAEALVGWLDER